MSEPHATTADLLEYIHQSPTPQHCVAETSRRLSAAGFTELAETEAWSVESGGKYYVVRDGSLMALVAGRKPAIESGFRLLGAHTDSPNLRVKPVADVDQDGYQQLGVEVYGGALTYTWLDRDLGLAGVVMVRGHGDNRLERHLVRFDRPMLRVPSLAIHLNRDVRTKGLQLNDQKHLAPVMGLGKANEDGPGALKILLGEELGVEPDRILSWELSLADVVPPAVGGINGEFIFSPRLDNQGMCHAGLLALTRATPGESTAALCLYDHEEVGSSSTTGAAGSLVEDVLRRLAETEGPGAVAGALPRAAASSYQLSADMAHAIHPNYSDKHEPAHHPALNGGPVIKVNAQQRYATSAETAALFESLCRDLEVPFQKFVTRTDLPCGSTIGPISASRLGIRTADVGNAMLSMHSIREHAGANDPEMMVRVMAAFLESNP